MFIFFYILSSYRDRLISAVILSSQLLLGYVTVIYKIIYIASPIILNYYLSIRSCIYNFNCYPLIDSFCNSLQTSGKTFLPELAVMKTHLRVNFMIILVIFLNCDFGLHIGGKHWLGQVMFINSFTNGLDFLLMCSLLLVQAWLSVMI